MVMATEKKATLAVEDAGGGEAMQCPDHPYRTNPGGVCAFCLQEKLGKLVSSSKSSSPFSPLHRTLPSPSPSPPSSSSSSPFPLDHPTTTSSSRRSRIPSFLHRKKNKKTTPSSKATHNPTTISTTNATTFTRSKSVAGRNPPKTTAAACLGDSTPLDSPRKRWFWSFLHLHPQTRSSALGAARDRERTRHPQSSKISGFPCNDPNPNPNSTNVDVTRHVQFGKISGGGIDPNLNSSGLAENNDVNASRCARPCNETKRLMESSNINASGGTAKSGAVEAAAGVGKVGRSRSVGCGSRSFSGDFLERISTGLGDCTLRRVESQREGKAAAAAGGGGGGRIVVRRMSVSGPTADDADDRSGQQRARCAGIFGMAMAAAAAPPCPAYWAAAEEDVGSSRGTPRARVRGWGWALASPIRALRSAARGHVEGSQEGGERKGAAAAGRTAGGGGGGGGGAPSALVSVRGW